MLNAERRAVGLCQPFKQANGQAPTGLSSVCRCERTASQQSQSAIPVVATETADGACPLVSILVFSGVNNGA